MYESDDIKVMHCFGTDVKNRYLKSYEHLYAMDTGAHYVCDKNGNPQAIVTASTNSSGGVKFDAATQAGIRDVIQPASDGTPVYVGIGKQNLSYYAIGSQNGPAAVVEDENGITFTSQPGMWFDITLPNLYTPRLMSNNWYLDVWSDDYTAISIISYYVGDSAFANYWYRAYNNTTSSYNAAPAMTGGGNRRLFADTSSLTLGGGTPALAATQVARHKIRITPAAGRTANFRIKKIQYDVQDVPCIAIVFDDNYASVITNGLPVLNARGLKASFGVIADVIGVNARYASLDQLLAWNQAGHECCTHGPMGEYGAGNFFSNNATLEGTAADIQYNRQGIISRGLDKDGSANALIWPQGRYWGSSQQDAEGLILARDLGFTHARSTIMPAFFNRQIATGEHQRYALPILGHLNASGTEAANVTAINNAIIECALKKKSGILMYHEVGNSSAGNINIATADFTTHMNTISALVAQGMITNKLFSKILPL